MGEGMGVNIFETSFNVSTNLKPLLQNRDSLTPEIDKWICTGLSF